MDVLRCVIVDDEPIARRGMRRLAQMRDELYVVGSASNINEVEKIIASESKPIDLLFLDIDMEGESGMDYARRLGEGPKIIFTTAYADYALDSYEVEAFDFLLKPIRRERFNRTIDRVLHTMERENANATETGAAADAHITVKADRKYVRVAVREILYIEGLGDYLVIHLKDRRLTTRMTFKKIEEDLEGTSIVRVNKSYMINTKAVDCYDSTEIRIGDVVIPVGSTYKDTIKKKLSD